MSKINQSARVLRDEEMDLVSGGFFLHMLRAAPEQNGDEDSDRALCAVACGPPADWTVLGPALAEPLPVPKSPGQRCPSGFASGAHRCTPMPGTMRDAVVKGQGACPSGWLQSGRFCLSPERRR